MTRTRPGPSSPMRLIGLLGGMSWESSALYYRIINEIVRDRLGGLHSAPCLLLSFDFAEIEALQADDRWDDAAELLAQAAKGLEAAGAELLVLCTNTMHKLAPALEAATTVPLLHIADATAGRVHAAGVTTVGLLGTRFTMEQDFYRSRLEQRHGLRVLVPDADDRRLVNRVIFEELVVGVASQASRRAYQEVIARLVESGAEGVILGCTEIELLVTQDDSPVPVFPTTRIHAEAAVEACLGR
jgi:aspartate racemase